MKTLVTGATGFIGKQLVATLVNDGMDVRCLLRNTSNKDKLNGLDAEYVYGDLLDRVSLNRAVKGTNIVYHLAGEVYSSDIKTYYKTNIQGTRNLIEASIDNGAEKVIFFSSVAAMGPNFNNKQIKEQDSCNPISHYGKSKLECEKIISDYSKTHGLPVAIIRPPVIYGPGINAASRALKLIQSVRNGKIIIPGKGNHRISLCYITNLIQGTLLSEKNARLLVEKYILTDPRSYTLNEIVDTIAAELGVNVSKIYIPRSIIQPILELLKSMRKILRLPDSVNIDRLKEGTYSWDCDITKARTELGYNPEIEIKEGLKHTIEWFQKSNL